MNKVTNTAASVLQRLEQLKGEFDATDTRPRARVNNGSVEIFKREKSSESLGDRVVNHLTRHSQRADAVKLVEAVLKDVERVLAPVARKDIQAALATERNYLQNMRPTNNGMRKTIANLEALLKANLAEPTPARVSTRAPKTVRPRLKTRTSKTTRPAWAGKGPSAVAGRAADTAALGKTTAPKMTKRPAAPRGRVAVAMTAQGGAVPVASQGKAKPVASRAIAPHTAAPDLASQRQAMKAFAANTPDWAEFLSHALTPSITYFDDDERALKDSTARTRAGVQAFQKFLHRVGDMTHEGIDAEWKKLNAKGKKSAGAEEFTAAEKMGISRFASQLVANPAAVGRFPWVPGVLAIANIVVAQPAHPSTHVPRPVR